MIKGLTRRQSNYMSYLIGCLVSPPYLTNQLVISLLSLYKWERLHPSKQSYKAQIYKIIFLMNHGASKICFKILIMINQSDFTSTQSDSTIVCNPAKTIIALQYNTSPLSKNLYPAKINLILNLIYSNKGTFSYEISL